MPKIGFSYELKGIRDELGRFARRQKRLVEGRREAMRAMGRILTTALRRNAPKDTGIFAAGLFYRTYDRGHKGFLHTYSAGSHGYLLNWIVKGTKPHKIPIGGSAAQIAKGYPLRFYWEKGPSGPGIYRFWSVNHPGTDPNPFIEETSAEMHDAVVEELNKVAASVARLR